MDVRKSVTSSLVSTLAWAFKRRHIQLATHFETGHKQMPKSNRRIEPMRLAASRCRAAARADQCVPLEQVEEQQDPSPLNGYKVMRFHQFSKAFF
jgi:hypothetical protein